MEEPVLHRLKVLDDPELKLHIELLTCLSVSIKTHCFGHETEILLTDNQAEEIIYSLRKTLEFKNQIKHKHRI